MPRLVLLSGGAAQGLVNAVAPAFEAATAHTIDGTFGAVGAMRAKLLDGHPADLVILTSAIVRDLAASGLVDEASVADIGPVETAVAVRAGSPVPAIGDEAELRAALLAADAIYFPDPQHATAGIHFASVLDRLGIHDEVRARLRTFPNGATAMRALAEAPEAHPIGCTQATEIIATPGIVLVDPLPPAFALSTMYTTGIVARSPRRREAAALIAELAADRHADLRARCGFL
jgi:molybdate transport system substrate-binding protein